MSTQQTTIEELPHPDGLEIIRLIGHGSMGGVYLAKDATLHRLVAVKVLRPELAADEIGRQRFEREAQTAARISHPNVTQVFSVGRLHNEAPYIVMEYIDGRNLADVIMTEAPMAIDHSCRLLSQMAAGLAAAHVNHIIHRDVSPANILIEKNTGRAVLTDFGLAAIQESGSEVIKKLTRTGERIGDPRYMSPEQHRGQPLTEQSDIYSLAVVAYEMLIQHSPFGGDIPADQSTGHLRRVPLNLNEIRSDIPMTLSEMLRSCLAKRPEHRPTIDRVIQVLAGDEELSAGEAENSSGTLPRFLIELKKRKVYQAAATYLAVALVILGSLDFIFPALSVPTWVFTSLVAISLGAFPFVVILAWIYDYHHGRLLRTDNAPLDRPSRVRTLLQVLGLVASLLLASTVAWWFLS